jgi:hypothetical protein
MAVDYKGNGNDDGTDFGRSDGKIGFYGLAAPIVKQTLTAAVAVDDTTANLAAGLIEINAALAALGILTTA